MKVSAVIAALSANMSGRYDNHELLGGRAYDERPAEKTIWNSESRR